MTLPRYDGVLSTMTPDLLPDLVDCPYTRLVRGALVGVVNTLRDQDRAFATLDDLAELLPGRAPRSTARALREAGWLFPMWTRGVWGFSGVRLGAPRAPGYLELHTRMRVRPDTPVCIAGKTVAMLHNWLWRPVGSAIGMPPGVKVPRGLSDFAVHRWDPQIGFDEFLGLPMCKRETLLCYLAARPSRICWEDVQEWLWAVCENLELDLLLTELEGRPRPVRMKTGYLADVGDVPISATLSPRRRQAGGVPMCSDGGNAACRIRSGTARCGYPNTRSSTTCCRDGGAQKLEVWSVPSTKKGKRDRKGVMRDRWEVDARPVALERDPQGVDPRPGWRVTSICSIGTEPYPSPIRQRVGTTSGQRGRRTQMRDRTHNEQPSVKHRRSVVPPPRGRRMMRVREVMEATGLSRTTIWRRERDGSFPPAIRLGGEHTRAVGWREQDIYDWIDSLSPAA